MEANSTLIYAIIFWLGIYLLPLAIGIAGVISARRAKSMWIKPPCALIGAIGLGLFIYITVSATPYLWAIYLESKWTQAKPTTQAEIETHLSLYRKYEIEPKDSDWGRNHILAEGDRMIRYMILGNAPLDVVYNSSNHIVQIYASYE